MEELCRSETADRAGIDNTPDEEAIVNLRDLCINLLQPLREQLEDSIHILSGYRTLRLNAMVGGVMTSQHIEGKAVDTVTSLSTVDWAKFIIDSGIEFDQLILEFYNKSKGPHSGWVHISYNMGKNRRQVLTAKKGLNGGTVYLDGVVE